MNYCTNCGKQIIPDSRFCSYCGSQVEHITPVPISKNQNTGFFKKVIDSICSTQNFKLGRFGNISINNSNKTFHIVLYEDKVKGIFFKKRVRGRCIINMKLCFSQLLNYKIIDNHNSIRTSTYGEKHYGRKENHEWDLGIELFIDERKQGYYYISFGKYFCIYHFPNEQYYKAKQLLGTLSSALEKIKQNR